MCACFIRLVINLNRLRAAVELQMFEHKGVANGSCIKLFSGIEALYMIR